MPARMDPAPSPEAAAMARETGEALEKALAGMSPPDAATLLAFARGERPELSGPTFRKRVERALTRLRARWGMNHGGL